MSEREREAWEAYRETEAQAGKAYKEVMAPVWKRFPLLKEN